MARSNVRDERDGREDRGIDNIGEGEALAVSEDVNALTAITKGEVDIQVATAKRYPRSIKAFMQDAMSQATQDEETAASCFFTLPRKKKTQDADGRTVEVPVQGPSVRLAEIVASSWGNLRAETRVIEEGESFVVAQGTAWDMERNVLIRSEVRRRITDKHGNRYSEDMVAVTANAATSIALRNAVFRVVPRSHVNKLEAAARKVAVGDEKTLSERRMRAFEWWAKAGVSEGRVLAALACQGLDDVGLEELETLWGFRTALKEGTAKIDELFPAPTMPDGRQQSGGKATPAPKNEPAHDPKTGEVKPTSPAATSTAPGNGAGF